MTDKTLTPRETLLVERAMIQFIADREGRINKERAKQRPCPFTIEAEELLLKEARELVHKLNNATYQCFYPGCGNFEVRAASSFLAAVGAIQFVKSKLGADHAVDGWKLAVVQEPRGQA